MNNINSLLDTFMVELKRGTLTLAVLSQLQTPQYGYSLIQLLEGKNTVIEAGTLYPLLRRLEKQNILHSEWDTTETRPRKYYVLSNDGKEVFKKLKEEWNRLASQMNTLLEEEK